MGGLRSLQLRLDTAEDLDIALQLLRQRPVMLGLVGA